MATITSLVHLNDGRLKKVSATADTINTNGLTASGTVSVK